MMGNSKTPHKLSKRGKVKDIYEYDEDHLMFEFSDRVSAFDFILPSIIPRKGEILCKFAQFWFQTLTYPNHFVKLIDNNKMVVKKLEMIKMECVVRGYNYGSLYDRVNKGKVNLGTEIELAGELKEPFFDPTTKSDIKDRAISKTEATSNGIVSSTEFDDLQETSIGLYKEMRQIAFKAGFIIADVKFEFGKDKEGNILLADSVGPDEFRLWLRSQYKPGKTQDSYDKQIIRDWLIEKKYRDSIENAIKKGIHPQIPSLPQTLINETQKRYTIAYETITGKPFENVG